MKQQMVPMVPTKTEEGNTKTSSLKEHKRVNPAKNWCFTYNNYKSTDIEQIELICSNGSHKYIFQEETGENGTKHLQGYIEFNAKVRPMSIFKEHNGIHWEKRKGTSMDCIKYCSKKDTRTGDIFTNFKLPKEIKIITNLYPWQKKLETLLMQEANDRTIHWYWEHNGNVGKSAFCKYLCVKHDAMITGGKASDAKFGIVKYHEKRGYFPDIIIMDIPRQVLDYVSYTAIEEIKNGCFYSTKYECDQVIMNSPHIICFANEPPSMDMMSQDRWNIVNLDD